jgi:hypothetical protein
LAENNNKRGRWNGTCTKDGIFVQVFQSIFDYSNFMQNYEKKESTLKLLENHEPLMLSNKNNTNKCFNDFIYLFDGIYNNFNKSYLQPIASIKQSTIYSTEISTSTVVSTNEIRNTLNNYNQTSIDLNDDYLFSKTDIDTLIRNIDNTAENIQNVILLITLIFTCVILFLVYLAFFKNLI